MTKSRAPFVDVDRVLGVVGVFLMLVVARLAGPAQAQQRTVRGRVTGFLARRGIDAVAAIGYMVDRLPLPGAAPVRSRGDSPSAGREERLHWV